MSETFEKSQLSEFFDVSSGCVLMKTVEQKHLTRIFHLDFDI